MFPIFLPQKELHNGSKMVTCWGNFLCTLRIQIADHNHGHIVNLQLKQKFDPPLDAKGEKSKQPWAVPFWLVTPAGDEEGNMIMTYETCKVAGFHINVPIMTNSVKLAAGALLIFGAATAKAEAASKKRKTAP